MGRKLPPKELELYRRCDEILYYMWDPIGVHGHPGTRDEYQSYLPQVFKLVREQAGQEAIVRYLLQLEEHTIGLSPNSDKTREIADLLEQHREWLLDEGLSG